MMTTSTGRWLSRSCLKRLDAPGRHPSSRCRVEADSRASPARSGGAEAGRGGVHRLLQPGRGLARRGGERDPQVGTQPAAQDRDHLGHRRRLARARPAGHDGHPRQRGHGHGQALVGLVGPGEEFVEIGAERGGVDVVRTVGAAAQQVVGHLHLLPPVPVEPEPGRDELQRRPAGGSGDHRARGARGDPARLLRPRQLDLQLVGLVGVRRDGVGGVGEVEHDAALPGAADGQRDGQQHALVGLAGQRAQPLRDVHVGGGQYAGSSEVGEQPGRPGRQEPGHLLTPRARASDRATTSGAGGRHANTPGTVPSAVRTPGPHMPRRNRYRTPPRCSAGS